MCYQAGMIILTERVVISAHGDVLGYRLGIGGKTTTDGPPLTPSPNQAEYRG